MEGNSMGSRFLKRLENECLRPILRRLRPSRHVSYAGIEIKYRSELDGGGTEFGQDFLPFLRARGMPKQQRAFEWCCGPGFIGFSLLGNGFCETLCLADINPEAVASCERTISVNGLSSRASVFQSDNLKDIPRSEKWNRSSATLLILSISTKGICALTIPIGAFTRNSLRPLVIFWQRTASWYCRKTTRDRRSTASGQ